MLVMSFLQSNVPIIFVDLTAFNRHYDYKHYSCNLFALAHESQEFPSDIIAAVEDRVTWDVQIRVRINLYLVDLRYRNALVVF